MSPRPRRVGHEAETILVPLGGGDSVSGGGGSVKRGGGAQRADSSAVAAAPMLQRWRQRDSATFIRSRTQDDIYGA